MALFKTSNPALSDRAFQDSARAQYGGIIDAADRMSLNGTIHKTGMLLICSLITAMWTWMQFYQTRDAASVAPWMLLGLVGGFIAAMVTVFKQTWAPISAPIYALLEGLALGGISAMLELRYPGIGIQAVSLTFGTLFVMLFLYRTRIITVTQRLRIGIVAATGAIALLYLSQMLLGFFGVHFTTINGSGPIGIGFSLLVVGIAAFNLLLDFDLIERGVNAGAPKYMEWYGAFGIMVTLVWLYIEMLRLLSKIRSRN